MIKNLPKSRFAAIVALFISLLMPTVAKAQEAYAVEDGTTLTFYYDGQRANRTGTVYGIGSTYGNTNITKAIFDASFKNYLPTSTAYWFQNCSKLAAIKGIENLNTENVTRMVSMFWGCSSLTTLDVTGFNTAKVTNMLGTFYGCSKLTSLDVSGFVTDNVTIMDGMFNGCSKLTTIDVSGFNTEKVTDMHNMFKGCSALEWLDLSNFNTEKVTNMSYMFLNCGALKTIYCNDIWTCDKSTDMFKGCTSLIGAVAYDASKLDVSMANPYSGYFTATVEFEAYAVEDGTTLTFYYDDQRANRTGTVYGIGSTYGNTNITKAIFDASFKNYLPTSTAYWFQNCSKLAAIEGLDNLNTENVTNMNSMFWGCSSLTTLDVTGFNTAKVTYMLGMFYRCSSLTSIDVTGFVTDNVTNMDGLFNGCIKLTTIDVSGFNTAKVTDMHNMFYDCRALTSLDLSNFNTEKVTKMNSMFAGCSALTKLDVSNFNTEKVIDMHEMFLNCGALKTIYCNDAWTCDNSTKMFYGCTSLVGAVAYDASKFDVSMANPETGYFTKGGATSVSEINADSDNRPTGIYNLHGVKMQGDLQSLPAGIYIVNGKKVIVK